MSIYFYAHTLIGVVIDDEKLYTRKTVKAFDHDYTEDINYSPITGEKLWTEEEWPINGYDEEENLFGYELVKVEGGDTYCCLISIRCDIIYGEMEFLETPFYSEEKLDEMMRILIVKGFCKKDDKYGLYCFGTCG